MNKFKVFGAGLALSLMLAGCTANEEDPKKDEQEVEDQEAVENTEDKKAEETTTPQTTELTVEQDTAEMIEKDEGVERAIIQLETIGVKKFVNAHITLNTMMNGEETAKKYAELLQEKYPERIVDMIISKDSEILYQGTFE